MSNARDPSSQESSDPAPDSAPTDDQRSGRIAYDERGNSVWEWQLETGVYSRDISTQRLKKLDLNDLSIAETATLPCPPGLIDPASHEASAAGGCNPYDHSTTARGNVASDPYNCAAGGALKRARKPLDSKKLDEWLELRKRVEQNKRDDD